MLFHINGLAVSNLQKSTNPNVVRVDIVANHLTEDEDNETVLKEAFDDETVKNFLDVGVIDYWHDSHNPSLDKVERNKSILGKPVAFRWENGKPVVTADLTKTHPIVRDMLPHLEAKQPVYAASIGGSKMVLETMDSNGQKHRIIPKIKWNHLAIAPAPDVINRAPGMNVRLLKAKDILCEFSDLNVFAHNGNIIGREEDLRKALEAPESVSDMYNTPGGSVTMQSLEGMLADLTLNVTDFTLWQDINKVKAFSTVEEYDQQIGLGINDGGFVGQIENPEFRDPDILKQIAVVKFMSEGWTVGDVAEATKRIIDIRTRSQRAAMTRLLRNLNIALYNGNSAWVPESIDGFATTIAAQGTSQIQDMRGGSVTMATFNLMGQLITEGNGHVENAKIYVSPAGMQNLAAIIEAGAASTGDRKIVEMGNGGVTIGGRIKGVMSAYGEMNIRMDKLLGIAFESKSVPQYYNNTTKTWVEGATSDKAPSAPSIALTNNAVVAGSLFSAGTVRPSGVKYSYRVSARNRYGRSAACAAVESTSVIAADGGLTIAITPAPGDAGSKLPTCFDIYSTKVGGSGVYRYMYTVAADSTNALAVVSYQDINTYIPGCARMYIIDQTQAGEQRVLSFSQLLPIHNTDLARTGRFSQGLINLYGVPKYYKPNVLVEIRNIGVDLSNVNLFNVI